VAAISACTEVKLRKVVTISGFRFQMMLAAILCQAHAIVDRLQIACRVPASVRFAQAAIAVNDLLMFRRLSRQLPEGDHVYLSRVAAYLGRPFFCNAFSDTFGLHG
jgi:hypothetical protein